MPSPKTAPLKRKAFFVDQKALGRAKRVLGVGTEAEAVRLSIERVIEMDRFWHFMDDSRRSVPRGSFDAS